MKKQTLLTSTLLVGVMSLFSLNASEAHTQATEVAQEALNEQAFVAKLSEQNQKIFLNQFTAEQKQKAMLAACSGSSCTQSQGKVALDPNDAVHKVIRENIAMAEKASPSAK